MLPRKRLFLGLGLLTCLGLAGITLLLLAQQPSPITPENFAKINPGMTEQEVVEILGPPGIRNTGQLDWDGPQWVATIYFDGEGRVSITMFGPNEHSFLRKFRHWLGL